MTRRAFLAAGIVSVGGIALIPAAPPPRQGKKTPTPTPTVAAVYGSGLYGAGKYGE